MAGIWEPQFVPGKKFFRLFFSHTSQHKAGVSTLKAALMPHGVAGFVAHQDIHPTREWQDVIEAALKECDALAAYLTPDFPASNWTDQEVGFCFARDVLILPIKVGVDPYGFIGKIQAVNGFNADPHVLAGQIAAILKTHPATRQRMAEAVVDRFAHSYSWNDARANLKRIEELPAQVWTPELEDAVRQAAADNEEVKTADLGFGRSTVAEAALKVIEP